MKRKIFLLPVIVFFIQGISLSQNVGVGTISPHSSAKLDISAADKGMLVPRIVLSAANVASPVSSPADALLIYNTASAGEGINSVTPGFYYWNAAAARWIAVTNTSGIHGDVGFGSWGSCTSGRISEYNPAAASDGSSPSRLGQSVSISGNFAIAGAPETAISGVGFQGAAYIYFFNGTHWVEYQKITASDGAFADFFGYSVFISGNYVIIGARNDDISTNADQGSAYIFFYNGSSWVQQAKLTASDGAANDNFGWTVSISGTKAIVGAPNDDVGINTNQGSAYIFHFDGTNWVQQPRISASDGASNFIFASGVAIENNFAVAGSPNSSALGSVYVFFYNGSTWAQQQKLLPNGPYTSDDLGYSVAISGNYIVAGAPFSRDNIGNIAQGAAYIYFFNGTNWVWKQQLNAHDGLVNDAFGSHVSISGNYALVGSHLADIDSKTDVGSAYLFQNIGGVWIRIQKILNPSGTAQNNTGPCGISNTRFILGASEYAFQQGMLLFGKVNN